MCSMLQQVQEDYRPALAAERIRCWFAAETAHESPDDHDAPANPALPSGAIALEELARRLGMRVANFNPATRPGVQGYLEPGENIIFLSANQTDAVRRFTLAHELGHAALHRAWGRTAAIANGLRDGSTLADAPAALLRDTAPEAGCDGDALDAPLGLVGAEDETLRPGQAYSAAARRESEANAFAAALLLPTDALLPAYLAAAPADHRRGADRVRRLSATFGVTEETTLRRLAETLADAPRARSALRASDAQATDTAGPVEGAPATTAAPTTPAHLDAEQAQAAQAPTPALVIAGPGAGKTTALLGRIVYLIQQRNVPPERILALTFSHRAARELHDRLAIALPGDATAGDAPIGLASAPTVNTIHGFCGEVLRMYGPLVGLRADYRLVNEVEGYFLLRELARDLPLIHYQPLAAPTLYYVDVLSAISRAKDELADPARYQSLATAMLRAAQTPEEALAAERANEIASVYAAYQAALTARGDPDFGDIIRLTVRLLREQPDVLAELRGRYQHLLVDEFQDINRAMGVLLHTLAGPRGPIWAVGDADQAIYRFRGAAPANLARFTHDYADAHVVTLRRNYRSQAPILEAAASVAQDLLAGAYPAHGQGADGERASVPASVGAALIPTRAAVDATAARAAVTLAVAPDDTTETAGLVADIQRRIAAGQAPGEMAVLCRTRRQVTRLVAALRRAGVATQAPMPLFEQPLVKDILATLSLLADASGAGLLRAGSQPDHAFTHEDAVTILRAARARGVTPLAAVRSLPPRPQLDADDDAPDADHGNGASAAQITPGASATTTSLTAEGQAGLARLSDILGELRRAPNVATGLARYVFSLTGLGARILAQAANFQAGDVSAGTDIHATDAARREALLVGRLLLLARAFDTQRAVEAQRAARDASALAQPPVSLSPFADWSGFLDYIRTLIALGQTGGADDPLAQEAVRVLTVHGSKGLEFPVVYLPGLVNRRFPMQRQREVAPAPIGLTDAATDINVVVANAHMPTAPMPTGAGPTPSTSDDTHMLEEACLFYVAITRARDELVLSYARRYGRAAYHPSPFLLPIERRLGARLARVNWQAAPAQDGFVSMRVDEPARPVVPTSAPPALPGAPTSDGPADSVDADQLAPLTVSALETYLRCPQQYAYRYLYGLGGQRLGMASLRQGLRETLGELHKRFDAALAPDGDAPAALAHHPLHGANEPEIQASATQPAPRPPTRKAARESAHAAAAGYRQPTLPSLDEARDLFDERLRQALGDAPREVEAPDPAASTDPLYAIYQRHGRRIAERLWEDLMRQRGLNRSNPPTTSHSAAPSSDADAATRASSPGAQPAREGLRRGDMRVMTVRLGDLEVAGALDHVEGLATPEPDATEDMATRARHTGDAPLTLADGPVRFVRYRASGAADDPTLSDLFYTLAAQQIADALGAAAAVEARHYNLATGESTPLALTPRQRERLERDLRTALAGLERADFAPKPEPRRCQTCPYLLICPA